MEAKIEFVRISETEYHLCEDKMIFLEDNIIYVEVNGEQTAEMAQVIGKDYRKEIRSFVEGPYKLLINLNNSGKNAPEARKVWKQISEDELTEKIALYGMHPVAKVLASFVMGTLKKQNVKFFDTREKAEQWLSYQE